MPVGLSCSRLHGILRRRDMGFGPGDVILEIEGQPIGVVRDLKDFVQRPYNGWRSEAAPR